MYRSSWSIVSRKFDSSAPPEFVTIEEQFLVHHFLEVRLGDAQRRIESHHVLARLADEVQRGLRGAQHLGVLEDGRHPQPVLPLEPVVCDPRQCQTAPAPPVFPQHGRGIGAKIEPDPKVGSSAACLGDGGGNERVGQVNGVEAGATATAAATDGHRYPADERGGQPRRGTDVYHAPSVVFFGTPGNLRRLEVRLEQSLQFPVECGEFRREVRPNAPEHFAHRVIQTGLDEAHRALAHAFEFPPAALHRLAQATQFVLHLRNRARAFPDPAKLALEIRAERRDQLLGGVGPRRLQHDVRHVEDIAEQIELRAEDVEREPLRLVVPGEEVDDGDVALLSVAMATADPLLDPLRVPRQVVVDDGVAELQVQPLRPRLRRDHDDGAPTELVHQREAHGNRRARRPGAGAVSVAPRLQSGASPGRIVVAPEQGDVLVAQFRLFEQEPAQVILGRQGLGEDHHLAPVRRPVHHHAHGLDETRRLAVPRQRAGTAHEVLDPREFVPDRLGLHRQRPHRRRGHANAVLFNVVLFLQVAHKLRRGQFARVAVPEHPAQPGRDPAQALRERRDRRRHAAVKTEQEQLPGIPAKGMQGGR